jgi:hypothetical protein
MNLTEAEAREIERRLRLILAPELRDSDCRCGECDALRAQRQADEILKILRR